MSADYPRSHLIFTPTGGPGCFSHVGRAGGKIQKYKQTCEAGLLNCRQWPEGQPRKPRMSQHRNYSSQHSPCTWFDNCPKVQAYLIPGAVHEISRSDRDNHVTILESNLHPDSKRFFEKRTNETYSTPFDTDSVMLWGSKDYGILDSAGQRKTTIQANRPGVEIRWKK